MRFTRANRTLLLAAALTLASLPAHANVIWPAGLEALNVLLWSVVVGLFIEWLVVRAAFIADGRTAFRAVAWANAASTVAGILLLPITADIVADIATSIVGKPYGREHEAACLFVYAPFAALFSAIIEWGVLSKSFGVPATNRAFAIVLAANVVTTAIAIFPAMRVLFG